MAGTGDTRIAPSTVPSSSAPTPPIRNSLMLTQKNWTKRSALSVSTETNSLIGAPSAQRWGRSVGQVAGLGAGSVRAQQAAPARSRTAAAARDRNASVLLELRRLRRRAGLAEGAVVDLLPGAVGERLGEQLVDRGAQGLVVVREPDAVLLGAERLA